MTEEIAAILESLNLATEVSTGELGHNLAFAARFIEAYSDLAEEYRQEREDEVEFILRVLGL